MRVVAGSHRGRRLQAPRGMRTRPTQDKVREALFSVLGPLEGLAVLDLFAGSGALGIEALSRGAARAVFVERDARAAASVNRNLQELGLEAEVHRRGALAYLRASPGMEYDLVFLDPPYDAPAPLAASLGEALPAVLRDNARIVTESDKRKPLDLPFPLGFERTYGDTRIAIYTPSDG